jgi:tetratricopeptide (TPR) repeat protein
MGARPPCESAAESACPLPPHHRAPERPIRLQPAEIKKTLDRAVSLQQAGKLREAERLYRSVIERQPTVFHAHHLLGVLLMQRSEFDEALACIDEAIRIEPRFPDSYHSRGKALAELGRRAEATESFNRALAAIDAAIRMAPNFAHAHYSRGRVLEELQRLEDALESYRSALRFDPKHLDALNNCGVLLQDLGRVGEAVPCFEAALALRPDFAPALINLGQALVDLDRPEEAMIAFDKAIALYPDHVQLLIDRGRLLLEFGRHEDAVASIERAVAVSPGHIKARFRLANIYANIGRRSEAAAILEGILAGCQGENDLRRARALIALIRMPPNYLSIDILPMFETIAIPDATVNADDQFRINLMFAKSRAQHIRGNHAEAWRLIVRANEAQRARLVESGADTKSDLGLKLKRIEVAAPNLESEMRDAPDRPVWLFLFGPSRAGKTTLEGLAATLEGVQAGGENRLVKIARHRMLQAMGRPTSDYVGIPTPEERAHFIAAFDSLLVDAAKGARVFTCTLPGYVGDIDILASLIPNMRFVFLKRDLDDTALRIYMKHYRKDNLSYAYNLHEIDDYISNYYAICDRLAAALPQRSIVLQYEQMIEDPAAARAAVARLCGLPVPAEPPPPPGDDRGIAVPYKSFMAEARAAISPVGRPDGQPVGRPVDRPDSQPDIARSG